MLEHFLAVAQQVFILFIMIAVGFVLSKAKMIKAEGVTSITKIVLYVVTPCVIVESFQREYDAAMLKNLGIACLTAILIHFASILIAHFAIREKDESRRRVLQFSTVFCNCGYMALPLQAAVLGSDGVFYCAAYIAVFNLFSWTYGIVLMGNNEKHASKKRLLLNPGIISVTIGLVCFLCQLKIPHIPLTVIHSFAALNTPLPMLVIGFYLAEIASFEILKNPWFILMSSLRLIVIPLGALVAMRFAGLTGEILVSLVISASAPTAANTVMYATLFDRDTALASYAVSITTLISILTMPLIVSLSLI